LKASKNRPGLIDETLVFDNTSMTELRANRTVTFEISPDHPALRGFYAINLDSVELSFDGLT